jgi:hypothetical protein
LAKAKELKQLCPCWDPSVDQGTTCSSEIFTEKVYLFSFKVWRNFQQYNEKRVDFSDQSHKKGDIQFLENGPQGGNMLFSLIKGADFFEISFKEDSKKSPLCRT